MDSTVSWYKILNCINPINKLMLTKEFDVTSTLYLLQKLQKFFKDLRSNRSLNEIIIDTKELIDEIDADGNCESIIPRHCVKNNFS